jgi:hypothetical protein
MKKLHFYFITMLLVASQVGSAQTADEIIESHLKAMGGKEKLQSIQTLIMEGKVTGQGAEFPITTKIQNKKGMRVQFNIMGIDAFIIMRPDSGWTFMPFQGQTKPEAMPEDQIKAGSENLDISGSLCDYINKGHTVEYLGLDDVEGTECHKLKLINKDGKISYYLIDPVSHYMVRNIVKRNFGGKEMEVETDFSNYKEIEGGYIFAHSIKSQNGPMEITKITINAPIDPSTFEPKI